ncbi:MAG: phosphoribosyltransferase family protein [Thermomicrobiales bacterium]
MIDFAPRLNPSVLAYLKKDGLLQEGHYVFPSGRHDAVLLNRDRLLANPTAASHMGYALAKAFFVEKVDAVASPNIWGGGLAQWVAYFLEPRASVVYATPGIAGDLRIAPNLTSLIDGKRVLLIDNIMLSGRTMETFSATVQQVGGVVVGVGTLWDGAQLRVGGQSVRGLLNDLYPAYLPADCPLCAAGEGTNRHALQHVTY